MAVEAVGVAAAGDRERAELERTWRVGSGVWGWLSAAEHHAIGKRFIVTAFGFFLAAGVLAALMRLQLSRPENHFLGPRLYNQIFTMHGTTMMFLFAVPVMEGLAVYLVPMMVGARNIAFPRLNAYSYWMFLFGGLMLFVAFFVNVGPDAGWFAYTPLSESLYSPGKRVDIWAQMITFTELSALAVAIEVVVTVLKLRAPGMSLARIPLFVWAMTVMSFMVLFAMPAIMLSSTALILDRLVATRFFVAAQWETRCCGSTSSGSSATRRSTSSSCRRRASSPPSSRPSPGGRSSATCRSCCRSWPPASSPSGSGCTTCSSPGSRSCRAASSPPRA
jgi:cytochrome c oxidase subunit 1